MRKRGFDSSDIKWFSKTEQIRLSQAKEEIEYLLDRNYPILNVVKFVSDRYQFSNRQRDALKRSVCTKFQKETRATLELPLLALKHQTLHIDGFNLIITLEVALSGGTLIRGRDGIIRDLAGLRGSYKLIEQTEIALQLLGNYLTDYKVDEVMIYLDEPVSNSRNLKHKIQDLSKFWDFKTSVKLVSNPDVVLKNKSCVVSGDAVVLDSCLSYFNLSQGMIERFIPDAFILIL